MFTRRSVTVNRKFDLCQRSFVVCIGAAMRYALLPVNQLTPTGRMEISGLKQCLKAYHHIYISFG